MLPPSSITVGSFRLPIADLLKAIGTGKKISQQPYMVLSGYPPRWHKFDPAQHAGHTGPALHLKTQADAAHQLQQEFHDGHATPFHSFHLDHQMTQINAKAEATQAVKSASAAVSGFKASVLAGKQPAPSQLTAFNAMPKEKREAMIAQLQSAQPDALKLILAAIHHAEGNAAPAPAPAAPPPPAAKPAQGQVPAYTFLGYLAHHDDGPANQWKPYVEGWIKNNPGKEAEMSSALVDKGKLHLAKELGIYKPPSATAPPTPQPAAESAPQAAPAPLAPPPDHPLAQGIAVKGWKKAVAAGKKPTPAQLHAFAQLPAHMQEVVLEDMPAGTDPAHAKSMAEHSMQHHAGTVKAKTARKAAVAGAIDMDGWQQVGPQAGSNPGGKFQAPDGSTWYVKFPKSIDHAKNELLAAKLYEAAGVVGPTMQLVEQDGKVGIAAQWVAGLSKGSPKDLASAPGAQDGFAVDAWLANWDVVGLGHDNLLMKNGQAVRVDTGGALLYRAQGSPKGEAFGNTVHELQTLTSASKNPQAAGVFGSMTKEALAASIGKVLAVSNTEIQDLVSKFGPGDEAAKQALTIKLIKRREYLEGYKSSLAPAGAAAPAGPKEGDTKPGANGQTLVLKDGHWVVQSPAVVAAKEAPAAAPAGVSPHAIVPEPAPSTVGSAAAAATATQISASAAAGDLATVKANLEYAQDMASKTGKVKWSKVATWAAGVHASMLSAAKLKESQAKPTPAKLKAENGSPVEHFDGWEVSPSDAGLSGAISMTNGAHYLAWTPGDGFELGSMNEPDGAQHPINIADAKDAFNLDHGLKAPAAAWAAFEAHIAAATPSAPAKETAESIYEHTTDGHNKFWKVKVVGHSLVTTYGKIGTKGTSSTKGFVDHDAAVSAMAKLKSEKFGKGYKFKGSTGAPASPAVVAAKETGPKEGDTKQENGHTYVLKNGHWERVEEPTADPDLEQGYLAAIAEGKVPTKAQAEYYSHMKDDDDFAEALGESVMQLAQQFFDGKDTDAASTAAWEKVDALNKQAHEGSGPAPAPAPAPAAPAAKGVDLDALHDLSQAITQAALPDTNTNAGPVNKKLAAIAQAVAKKDLAALQAMTFGSNTYGVKAKKIAAMAMAVLGGAPAAPAASPTVVSATQATAGTFVPKAPAAKGPKPPPKPKPDPTKLQVNPDQIPAAPVFTYSSKKHVNDANSHDASQLHDYAMKGNLVGLEGYHYTAVDKEGGHKLGAKPIQSHPSQHVKSYWSELVASLQLIANPPEALREFSAVLGDNIKSLSAAFKNEKYGVSTAKAAANKKLAYFIALGKVASPAQLAPPPQFAPLKFESTPAKKVVVTAAQNAKAQADYAALPPGSLVKKFINAIQASGSYNDQFRDGQLVGTSGHFKGLNLEQMNLEAHQYAQEKPAGFEVYKWINLGKDMVQQLTDAPVGTVFQNPGSMCTSTGPTGTAHFGEHRMRIRYAPGAKGVDSYGSGNHGSEKEITTLPGSRYVILSANMVQCPVKGHKRLELDVLMLPPDETYVADLKARVAAGKGK